MKTPQEAAREYAEHECEIWCGPRCEVHVQCNIYKCRIKDFLAGDEFGYHRGMEKAYRWISVEEELPEVGKNGISATVLVRAGNYHCASYCKNKYYPQGAWFDPAMDLSIDVTHWRPIEPIKE